MAKKINVAINGFGRIGRTTFKTLFDDKRVAIVAINDLTDPATLAHLLKHDTSYRQYQHPVSASKAGLKVAGQLIPVLAEKEPEKLPWKELAVDVVLECTGRFTDKVGAGKHLIAGAKRVIISAPAKGEDVPIYLLGVNAQSYRKEKVISMGSCTTNSIAALMQIISKKFGVLKSSMTTVHSYTADQNLQDAPHKDLRRARGAAESIVPTTTGAAVAVSQAVKELTGKFDGLAIRVPTPVVSLSDCTILTKKKVTIEQVNQVLTEATKVAPYKGVLAVTNEELVSSDFIGHPASGIIDLKLTNVVDGDLLKVVVWYDNEWGYSSRLADMAVQVGQSL